MVETPEGVETRFLEKRTRKCQGRNSQRLSLTPKSLQRKDLRWGPHLCNSLILKDLHKVGPRCKSLLRNDLRK